MTFDTDLAVALREAIRETIGAMQPDPMVVKPAALIDELQRQLQALHAAEGKLFLTGEPPIDRADFSAWAAAIGKKKPAEATPKPWYPDNSGEWVEVPDTLMEMPKGLQENTEIQSLLYSEREQKKWDASVLEAWELFWGHEPGHEWRIVAYKIVKP